MWTSFWCNFNGFQIENSINFIFKRINYPFIESGNRIFLVYFAIGSNQFVWLNVDIASIIVFHILCVVISLVKCYTNAPWSCKVLIGWRSSLLYTLSAGIETDDGSYAHLYSMYERNSTSFQTLPYDEGEKLFL